MADNYTHFTPLKREKFLKALAKGATVTKAAQVAGVNRRTAYAARDADEEFGALWDEAIEEGTDLLEDEILRRSTEGLISYQFTKTGQPIMDPRYPDADKPYFERKYSDTLLMFLAKGRRPEKFRERSSVEISGKLSTLPADLSNLNADELNDLENLLAKASRPPNSRSSSGGEKPS